ncbi:MAG: glycerophosphodiester phosphodiesterase [Elusimicrobia bacterium]|nr:glycerophosphodiester phosphodiesterase [Elusimicrobiota bacterium]
MRLIAHRGASGTHPENTLAAFRAAWAAGADAVEFDVQRSKDGALVVVHDDTLARTAGDPRRVGEATLAELKGLDAGAWKDPRFAGERIPTLAELVDAAPAGCWFNLEVKQPESGAPYAGIERDVKAFLDARPEVKARTLVSSFHQPTLRALRALDASVRLGVLPGRTPIDAAFALAAELRAESMNVNLERLTPEWAARAKAAGLSLLVYTIVEQGQLDRAAALGADGVFSNFPGLRVPA